MADNRRILIDGESAELLEPVAAALGELGWEVKADDDLGAPAGVVILAPTSPGAAGGTGLDGLVDSVRAMSDAVDRALSRLVAAGEASLVLVSPPLGSERHYGLAQASGLQRLVTGIARGLAVELGERGIRVNAVLPGVLRDDEDPLPGAIPLVPIDGTDRRGAPVDIAHAIDFLLSSDAAYVTGIELVVDGGLSQCRSSAPFALWDSGITTADDPPLPAPG